MRPPKHLGILVSASLILTLAVGANAAVFTLVNALLIRRQPVESPETLVVVVRRDQPLDPSRWSDLGMDRLRATGLFAQIAGEVVTRESFSDLQPNVLFSGFGRSFETAGVTAGYFETLGVQLRGRSFLATEDVYEGKPVGVISDDLWRDAFGRDPSIIGRTVAALPEPVSIVGVAPPGFGGALHGEHIGLWLPHHLLPRLNGVARGGPIPMLALARLESGVPIAAAQAWFAQSSRRSDASIEIVPLARMFGTQNSPAVVIREQQFVTIVMLASLLVLLVGSTALAGLMLVHYHSRHRELAIRSALGATSSRLRQQLLLELLPAIVISAVGSSVLGQWIIGVLPHLRLSDTIDISRLDLSADWRVSIAAGCASALTLATAGGLGVTWATRIRHNAFAAAGACAAVSRRARDLMLLAQAAIATLLLLLAAMLVRTMMYGVSDGAGFDVQHTLFVTLHVSTAGVRNQDAGSSAAEVLMDRIRSMPAVDVVALGPPPLGPRLQRQLGSVQTIRSGAVETEIPVAWISAGRSYLQALGVPALIGENSGGDKHAVVSASLADDLWPGMSPIGQPISYGPFSGTVVGVIDSAFGSVKFGRPAAIVTFEQETLLPRVLRDSGDLSFVVRARDPKGLAPAALRLVEERFADAPAAMVTTGLQLVQNDLGRERLAAWLFSGFGVIAVALAVGSVFGLVICAIQLNRRSYAVMLALGATAGTIARDVVWRSCRPAFLGASLGILGALMAAPVLRSALIALIDIDAKSCLAAAGLLVLCSGVAATIAAARISHVEPMEVLKEV